MTSSLSRRHDYRNWPFLSQEEFELACAFFDQKYVKAELGSTRRALKIRPRRALTTGNSYLELVRLLQPPQDTNELSLAFERLGRLEQGKQDFEVEMMVEDIDQEELQQDLESLPEDCIYSPSGLQCQQPHAKYEIHLHPTYSIPVLWFSLHELPLGEPSFDLESVYRHLVPSHYKSSMRSMGIIGGISAAPHPITDVPAFFIHPCQTKEAMQDFDCSLDEYLILWLGLVGPCIGLWVPPEMAV